MGTPTIKNWGAVAVVQHPPYFGYIYLHSCKHKTVTLKRTLTLILTLTDTGGAVLYRLGSGLRNTAGGERKSAGLGLGCKRRVPVSKP